MNRFRETDEMLLHLEQSFENSCQRSRTISNSCSPLKDTIQTALQISPTSATMPKSRMIDLSNIRGNTQIQLKLFF